MSPAEARAFLEDSLALWRVDASVVDRDDAFAIVGGAAAPIVVRQIVDAAASFRWTVEAPGLSPRHCPSVVVMLATVRDLLEVAAAGAPLRIGAPTGP